MIGHLTGFCDGCGKQHRELFLNDGRWLCITCETPSQCLARFEVGRAYPCTRPSGHVGAHAHPMDPLT